MDNSNIDHENNTSSGKEHNVDKNKVLDSAQQPKKKKKKTNSLKEKEKERQPVMSEVDFVDRYPHTDAAIPEMIALQNMTRGGLNMMRKAMTFVSEKELDDMEKAWKEYHLQGIELLQERILVFDKHSSLVQKALKAQRSSVKL